MRSRWATRAASDRGAMLGVGAATGLAALSSWVVQAVASRRLGVQGFADFMAVWGLFFGVIGCLQGIQQEVTRAVGAVHAGARAKAGVLSGPLLLGVGGATIVILVGGHWLRHAFGGASTSMLAALALAAIGYAGVNALGGALAGSRRWAAYSLLVGSEAVIRSTLLVLVLLFSRGESSAAVAGALAAGSTAIAVILLRPSKRAVLKERVDVSVTRLVGRSAQVIVAAGSAALVLAGFPLLLKVTADGPLTGDAGVLIAGVVATRAPTLLVMTAYQTAMIRRLTGERRKIWAGTLLFARRVLVASALVTGLTWACGPWVLAAVFGGGFRASGQTLALLALGAGFSALLFVTGAATLASGHHAIFTAGWLVNLAATIASLALVSEVQDRVLLAVLLGPITGLIVHGAALMIAQAGEE